MKFSETIAEFNGTYQTDLKVKSFKKILFSHLIPFFFKYYETKSRKNFFIFFSLLSKE